MEYIIKSEQLVKKYGNKAAVDHVDLHVKKGDIYGLIGKNGAGKTTLMKLLLGLEEADSGVISLFEADDLVASRRKIGSIIEEPGLYYDKSAFDNMKTFSLLYGNVSDSDIKDLLEKVGLGSVGKKKIKGFSLGMRQRLGIAIALMGKPDILILDEPINGLDPEGIKEIRDMILKMNEEGVTFMISSHLLDELGKIGTRYGIMSAGRLVEELSAEELKLNCRKRIEIVVDDVDTAIKVLKDNIPEFEISKGNEEGLLYILSEVEDSSVISKLLVTNNISLYSMHRQGSSLEEYFMESLGGK